MARQRVCSSEGVAALDHILGWWTVWWFHDTEIVIMEIHRFTNLVPLNYVISRPSHPSMYPQWYAAQFTVAFPYDPRRGACGVLLVDQASSAANRIDAWLVQGSGIELKNNQNTCTLAMRSSESQKTCTTREVFKCVNRGTSHLDPYGSSSVGSSGLTWRIIGCPSSPLRRRVIALRQQECKT